MTSQEREDLVSYLVPYERGGVLGQLLNRHPDLRDEANVIARDMLDDVSVERISRKVAKLLLNIDIEDLGSRAGKKPWGYVEPSEAGGGSSSIRPSKGFKTI